MKRIRLTRKDGSFTAQQKRYFTQRSQCFYFKNHLQTKYRLQQNTLLQLSSVTGTLTWWGWAGFNESFFFKEKLNFLSFGRFNLFSRRTFGFRFWFWSLGRFWSFASSLPTPFSAPSPSSPSRQKPPVPAFLRGLTEELVSSTGTDKRQTERNRRGGSFRGAETERNVREERRLAEHGRGGVHHSGCYLHQAVICRVEEEVEERETSILRISELHLLQFRSTLSKSASFSNLLSRPGFKYLTLVFLHVICMQLIKPAPFPSPLRRQSSLLLLHQLAGCDPNISSVRTNGVKMSEKHCEGAAEGKFISVCLWGGFWSLSAFLFFFVFLEDSHSDLFVWDSESTPPTPPIHRKKPISCRDRRRKAGGRMNESLRKKGMQERLKEEKGGRGWTGWWNERFCEPTNEWKMVGKDRSRLLDSRRLLETLGGLWDRRWDDL